METRFCFSECTGRVCKPSLLISVPSDGGVACFELFLIALPVDCHQAYKKTCSSIGMLDVRYGVSRFFEFVSAVLLQ